MSTNDPGGGEGAGGQKDISSLQENFNRQQEKISALKELVRKSEAAHGKSTSSAQEKVKNIAQRLTHLKSKARSRQNLDRSLSELRDDPIIEESQQSPQSSSHGQSKARSETPGSEKIQLLRKQMEENKLKMAERENSKREIEELVTQLKAKFDSTQQSLERSSELGRSMGDLSVLGAAPAKDKFKSATDLSFTPLNLDKERIKFLENRIRLLEKQAEKQSHASTVDSESEKVKSLESKILDLEENLKEKECIIQARTQAVSLMSESLSAKGKNTVDMLEDTRQEMFKMQSSFIETEDSLRADIQQLREELEEKCSKIKNLEEVNDILETARFDLTIKNAELESKIQDVQEYSTKLSELNKLNESLQHRIEDLESQKYEIISAEEVDVAKQVGTEYVNNMQALKDKIKELETENDYLKKLAQTSQSEPDSEDGISDKIKSLDATIAAQREEIENQQKKIQELEELVTEKTIECNVLNANFSVLQEKLKASAPKSLFSKSTDEEAELEINKLKAQLDEANKSMIKTKLKTKQLQKQVDSFKKMNDVNGEVTRLTEENQQLQQKIAELEEEKGSLQLKLISGESVTVADSELEKKIQVLETTCQNQTSAIQLLEEQKLDMTENLHSAKQELESLKDHMHEIDKDETARVVSQMESVQLEEKVGDYLTQIDDLKSEIERYKKENENLHEELNRLDEEKNELLKKIDHYVADNMELLDKVEKLSKSSSSAESIEIVERLTQQEKLEMEAFNKKLSEDTTSDTQSNAPVLDVENNEMGQELSDSLIKLREESSELMHRIELFTTERREVLEKMEILSSENQEYIKRIADLNAEKSVVQESLDKMKVTVEELESKLQSASEEKDVLLKDIKEISENRDTIKKEIEKLEKEKESTATLPSSDPNTIEACEKSLSRMFTELENYRKCNDKGTKLSSSKKLAKEVKNAHQQLDELIKQLKASSEKEKEETSNSGLAIEELKTKCADMEKVIENLKTELNSSKETIDNKNSEIDQLKSEVTELTSRSSQAEKEAAEKSEFVDEQISHLKDINKELEAKLQTSDKEMEILKTLVAEQKQQLIESYTDHENEISAKLEEIKGYEEEIDRLKNELETIQNENTRNQDNYAENMKEEMKKLENALSANKKLLDEQSEELNHKQNTIDTLNSQIMDLYRTMEDNANKVIEKDDEIAYLQEVLDSNRKEVEMLRKETSENKTVTEKLLVELHSNTKNLEQLESLSHVQEQARVLETRVKQLEQQNSELDNKNKEQLDKLKKFAANLKKKVAQCTELEKKLKSMEKDNQSESHDSTDHVATISALQSDLNKYRDEAESLRASFDKGLESLSIQVEYLKTENTSLQAQLNASLENSKILATDYQSSQSELFECRTRIEILEREKNELEALINSSQTDASTKHDQVLILQKELEEALVKLNKNEEKFTKQSEDLKTKNLKFEKCKAVIKEKNKEIQRLNTENQNLQSQIQELSEKPTESNSNLEAEYKKLKEDNAEIIAQYESEKEAFQQTISRLETLHDGIQAKLQEDMVYIESLEAENNKFKEKIFKLEDCVASFEERRASLERQTNILDAQLQKRVDEYEKNEDALIYRLNMLSDHDDVLGRRLLEKQEENEELSEKLDKLKMENSDLNLELSKLEKELELFKTEKYNTLEAEKISLCEQNEALRLDLTRQQNIYEGKLSSKHSEIDDLENELSVQLQRVNQEKRTLQESLEKSEDEVVELKDENVRLKENVNSLEQVKNDLEREITWIRMQNENLSQDQYELQELRMQIMHDKTEIENQKHQLETLAQNHEIELNALKQQIAELDSMRMQVGQNQTDDQVFIETENKRLKDLLVERDAAIESYQRENLKLQMASLTAVPADPFSNIAAAASHPQTDDNQKEHIELTAMREKVQALESQVAQLQAAIAEKDEEQNNMKLEMQQLNNGNSELQKMYFDRQNEVVALKTELEKQTKPAGQVQSQDLNSHFYPSTSAASFFDDIAQVKHVEPLQGERQEQKTIEDLERNVSDLEKYVTDLEIKLKNLTTLHEETLLQLQTKTQQYEESIKSYEERLRILESEKKELEVQKSVESLIVSEQANAQAPSLQMFFDAKSPQPAVEFDRMIQQPSDGVPVPVQEEVIVPKKAYLLYPDADAPVTEVVVPDDGDGWGWGSEEAALEEKHQKSTVSQSETLAPQTQNLELKLQEYQDRVQELELERNRLDEKVIEMQVKSGKMIKKLKEYKLKIDQQEKSFRKSSSIESNDLDLAIQEELKSQVTKLEEMLGAMKEQHNKEIAEKNNLLKRIDVLTSANDRMTEMKERQDIEVEMYQTKVRQLNQQLQQLGDWGEQSEVVSTAKTVESAPSTSAASDLERKLTEAQRELEDIKVDRDELQALLDDEKNNVRLNESKINELQAKLVALKTKSSDEVNKQEEALRIQLVQKETDLNNMIIKNQNLHLQLSDYQLTIEQLSQESNSIKAQLEQIQVEHKQKVSENENLSKELDSWIKKSNELSQEIENMRKDTKGNEDASHNIAAMEEKLQELHAQLEYKDAEIVYLKKTLEDTIREDQTQSLVQEMLVKTQEINQLRQQVQALQTDKVELENNLSLQLTRDMTNKTDDTETLQRKIQTLEQSLQEIKSEKEHMEGELQVLNNHVIASLENEDKMKQTVLELDTKNIEIAELKKSLELLKQQQSTSSETSKPADTNNEQLIADLNAQWKETVEQRCTEIAESWRQHLVVKEQEFQNIESNLLQEIEKLRNGTHTFTPPLQSSSTVESSIFGTDPSEIDAEMIQRMQSALESQELEIVTLKEQLAMRSAEYARLAARHDPYAMSTSSNISFDSTKQQRKLSTGTAANEPQTISKTELDLALYMLHQRDMRCEELTLELVNLLEERDTLQLKLSNSLRQVEEIKRKTGYSESGSESDQGPSNPASPERMRTRSTGTGPEDDSNDNLNSKLSQIHAVNHAKDKRLWEDREQRQRQMEKLQQDVANIPSEAVSELVGADLTNTAQRPSTVLLNWLWGNPSTNNPQS